MGRDRESSQLDLQFAEAMKNHSEGVAMYRPPRSSLLRLGTVGYFDDNGAWNDIVNLTDAKDLARKGLGPMNADEIETEPVDDGITWGPRVSTSTRSNKINLSGGVAPAPGIPVNASTVVSYETHGDTGAVLLTSPPIRYERLKHPSQFQKWMADNALKILEKYPDEIKYHGLWIVTSIYTTEKCSILMWHEEGKKVSVGFSADVTNIGSLKSDLEWYGASTDAGWSEYRSHGEDRRVVFFGGLKFRAHRWYNPKKGLDLTAGLGMKAFTANSISCAKPTERIATVPDPESEDHEFHFEVEERLTND